MIQKFLPSSPNSSRMAYEVYHNRNSPEEDFRLISDMYARVMREDKVLCNNAQKNLERGVFINGQLHPKYEKAPLFFQQTVREVITEHYNREEVEKQEIWPARQKIPDGASETDERICADISCGARQGPVEKLGDCNSAIITLTSEGMFVDVRSIGWKYH